LEARGTVWKFALDDINTDQIHLSRYSHLAPEEIAKHCMETIDPSFAKEVKRGDVVVAGENFGCGSARPAHEDFLVLGVSAIVAESFDRKFFHNCLSGGLLVVPCEGILAFVEAGHDISVRPRDGAVVNHTTGQELSTGAMPTFILEMIECGGELGYLKRHVAKSGGKGG
jgi:3-isopropylmalate/(R)-2-methylmalate dehydratase small subunit